MKSILGMTALAALMMGATVTTVQAEGGSERPTAAGNAIEQQQRRIEKSEPEILRDRALYGSSSNQRFVRMLEEQPAVAGPAQQAERSEPGILRDRALYGSASDQDSSQRFVRMLEEQPAAAGPAHRTERSEPGILRQRVLYGPH